MSSGEKSEILARVRKALGRGPLAREQEEELGRRLETPSRNLIPARAQLPHEQQIALFIEQARKLDMTVERLPRDADAPAAIARYLDARRLPRRLRLGSSGVLMPLSWPEHGLDVQRGPASREDPVGVVVAHSAVAETGTLITLSGPDCPSTLNFVPPTYVAIVRAARIVGTLEDVWTLLRADHGQDRMPASIHMISGTSLTGDIEGTLVRGAHGPLRVLVIITEGRDVV